jgi:hypothetical protein
MSQIWDIDIMAPASTSPSSDAQRLIDGLNTLRSNWSGASEPAAADRVAYMLWADTTTGLLKIRNAANSAWVTIGILASANLGLLPLTGGTLTGRALTASVAVAFAASLTVDTTLGNYIEIGTLTGNVTTFTLSNPVAGHALTIRFKQDATGGRTVATPSGAKINGSISGSPNVVSHLSLTYSAADSRWEGYYSSVPA